MSLHPYIPPPPLALTIVPAPPIKPPKPRDKDKEAEKNDKPADQDQNQNQGKDKDKDKAKADDKDAKPGDAGNKPDEKEAGGKKADDGDDAHKTLVDIGHNENDAAKPIDAPMANAVQAEGEKQMPDVPETPLTPVSMLAGPPTPALAEGDAQPDGADKPKEDKAAVEGKAPNGEVKSAPENKDEKDKKEGPEPEPEAEAESKPLCLIGPTPHTPIRTRLSMNQAKPYPPIDTDPRGAYHLYAKGCSKEWILIDVTKDGWMSENWRGKEERDALARLRGEDVRRAERELEKVAKLREKREVPATAGELLVQLWNDLAEAPWTELPTEVFWDRYDWSTPSAQVHAKSVPKDERKDNTSLTIDGQEVEWTKEGVEEILGTVGVQCAYNSDEPIHRQWTGLGPVSMDRAFLLLGHGYFILRPKEWLIWKPEETGDQFEVLVTSGHDRVFGDMVKAQRIEAKKKDQAAADKAKKAAAAAAAEAEKQKVGDEGDKQAKGGGEVKDSQGKAEVKGDGQRSSKEGEKQDRKKGENEDKSGGKLKVDVEDAAPADAEADAVLKEAGEAKVMLAVPVKDLKDLPEAAKHEHEVKLAPPGEAGVDVEKPKHGGKDKDKGDAKVVGAGDNLKMEDIKAVFQALEAAAGGLKEKKAESEQLIWTWGESCERWRWKNYEAGVHNVGLGGWEERDWKVFADGKCVEDFEGDMESAEVVEVDIHDWSC